MHSMRRYILYVFRMLINRYIRKVDVSIMMMTTEISSNPHSSVSPSISTVAICRCVPHNGASSFCKIHRWNEWRLWASFFPAHVSDLCDLNFRNEYAQTIIIQMQWTEWNYSNTVDWPHVADQLNSTVAKRMRCPGCRTLNSQYVARTWVQLAEQCSFMKDKRRRTKG